MRPLLLALAALVMMSTALRSQVSTTDTRLLSQPALSATHVAFVYARDLWSARIDGSDVRRLTSDPGLEDAIVINERFNGGGQVADYYKKTAPTRGPTNAAGR